MAHKVGRSNGDQECQKDRMDLGELAAGAVEEDGEEADGDMEDFSGDLMAVNLEYSLALAFHLEFPVINTWESREIIEVRTYE